MRLEIAPPRALGAALRLAPLLATLALDGAGDDRPAGAPGIRSTVDAPVTVEERDPAREAVERGLAYLSREHALLRDGSFPAGRGASVGVTALCVLAFMAEGHTAERGPYHEDVGAAIDYLLTRVTPADHEHAGYIADSGDPTSRMHGHGLATLALAEAYGMSPQTTRGRRTAAALPAAVHRIEVSQGVEGGWHYAPERQPLHEGSVTVCLVQALRAANDAGVDVDSAVIARAVDYVRRLQNEDGSFRYGLDDEATSVALTGACLSTLQATGIYDGHEIEDGYDYIWRELAHRDLERDLRGQVRGPEFPYYERFYLSQAMWHNRDAHAYETWAGPERQRVLTSQEDDGSWSDARYGSCYATAMNCLFLSLPRGVLPVFER